MPARPKITPEFVEKAGYLKSTGIPSKEIAWILDVSEATVSRALKLR